MGHHHPHHHEPATDHNFDDNQAKPDSSGPDCVGWVPSHHRKAAISPVSPYSARAKHHRHHHHHHIHHNNHIIMLKEAGCKEEQPPDRHHQSQASQS